mmetsp:Transcript_59160/g.105147  ORF Transcript_59160/g.105147 Transcript_59160/m.105147 type:complete len:204 (-) Transcript_59160:35-646(-)
MGTIPRRQRHAFGLLVFTSSALLSVSPAFQSSTLARRGVLSIVFSASAPAWATSLVEAVREDQTEISGPPQMSRQRQKRMKIDKEFLEKKAKEAGVITLPSGLMYKILDKGPRDGPSPGLKTKCSCTYTGQLTDGKTFDYGTIKFAPKDVIKGWTEAMQLMKQGDRWELYIPSDLAYGEGGAGGRIPAGAALVFSMKINKVLS